MAFGDPGRAETEAVGEIGLLEEVREHRPLVRQVAMHLGLADGEEDVEFHRTRRLANMNGERTAASGERETTTHVAAALAVAFALLAACSVAIPSNEYGLRVVPDVATYARLAAHDPDKRLVEVTSVD